ncbi:hypothetical protein [Natrinema sp. 1APR25-10V2]|nr:hypothetical protein [Natrinema sp. 1APR25-10V2]
MNSIELVALAITALAMLALFRLVKLLLRWAALIIGIAMLAHFLI